VARGLEEVWVPRALDQVRKALADQEPAVVDGALRTLRRIDWVGALPYLTRIFRESSDERVRLATLEGIGISNDRKGAARVLLEAARQETGTVRRTAEEKLERVARSGGDEIATLLRQARDIEAGDRRDALERILKSAARV
jgi:hypothetical protein